MGTTSIDLVTGDLLGLVDTRRGHEFHSVQRNLKSAQFIDKSVLRGESKRVLKAIE